MRILKIWDSEYPWDVRAEKVMRSLADAGHEVHLAARNRKDQPLVEEMDEATVHRLKPWRTFGRRIDHASQFPAFFNPRWLAHLHGVGRRQQVDLILVRDLPLTPAAVWVGRRLGVPVVLDMAENYAAMMRDLWTSGSTGPLDWAIRNPSIVARVERWAVHAVDHIVVVVEESGERLQELGVAPEAITVVVNTPWPTRIPDQVEFDRGDDDRLDLVYLGLLERPRGVGTVLDALSRLVAEGRSVHLDVIGGGRGADDLHRQVESSGLSGSVEFHGVLPYEKALAIVRRAHVGLVPHFAVESWNTTIPNKLFDYMSHGLPVVTSNARPAARVVSEVGCGVVFESEDDADLARALRTLSDPATRREMGERGRAAVQTRFNWNEDGARLVAALEALVR